MNEASDPNKDPLFCILSEVVDCSAGTIGPNTFVYKYDNTNGVFVEIGDTQHGDTYVTRYNFLLSETDFITDNTILYPKIHFSSLGYQQAAWDINTQKYSFGNVYSLNSNMHVDVRDMELIPDYDNNSLENILIGNDGGVSLSTDGGLTWSNLNGPGLTITQFNGMDVAEENTDIILGGTQDNNAYKYVRSSDSWQRFAGGDVYNFQISEIDIDRYFYSYNGGNFFASMGSISNQPGVGGPIQITPTGLSSTWGPNSLPQYQHPSGVIYYGQKELGVLEEPCYRSRFISDIYLAEGLDSKMNAIGVCEHNPEVIYIGYSMPEQGNNPNPKKVFKTTNGTSANPTWVDITDNIENMFSNIFDWIEISDIVVNPTNPLEVWISFHNIAYDGNDNGIFRVIHSIDGGTTWNDQSNNLPSIPVNDIEYLNGSNGGIFAATDAGIFYTDNVNYSNYGWMCISGNLPVMLINDIEINYSLKKIVAASFGRGIFEANLDNLHILPFTFNTNNPFACNNSVTVFTSTPSAPLTSQTFCGDVEINPGVTVTITGTIRMKPGTEIRVKNSTTAGTPGGQLIIDGGTITAAEGCNADGRWKGIFVMGDPTKSQAPLNTTQQGVLQVINGGVINDAVTAAYAGRFTGFNPSNFTIENQGGIIITDDAYFVNNERDIVLWPYSNFLNTPANPIANRSRFTKTKFLTINTSAINNLIETDRTNHLTLLGVNGILIRECHFDNRRNISNTEYTDVNNDPSLMAMDEMGTGIYSVNSSFRVTGFCDFYSQQDTLSCQFENLFKKQFYAIKAISSDPLKTAFIDGNVFIDNYHGIFLNGVDYSYLARNWVSVRNIKASVSLNTPTTQGTDIPYGLHLNQCNNYRVTENYFNSLQPGTQNPAANENLKVSMQTSLPDGNPEEIYNNIFKDYHSNIDIDPGVGILVQGDPNDTDPNNLSGLQLLCNDFHGAYLNVGPGGLERYTNHIALTQNGKVAFFQGADDNVESPAGNTFINQPGQFHDNCTVNSVSYPEAEYNTTDGLINGVTYYHHPNSGAFPISVQCGSTDVTNSPVTSANSDYAKSTACTTAINPNPQPHLIRQQIRSYIDLANFERLLIDGGDTEGLIDLISTATPGQVKDGLLEFSPYLSDKVLRKFMNSNPPHGILKEVLLANSPLSKEIQIIVDALDLPSGIKNEIEAAQTGISERQNLEARIDWFELKKEQIINDLVRYHLLRDTVPDYLDSLKLVFAQYSPNHNACKIASAFATQKDFIQALAILDAHLAEHPDDALCKLQKLMIEFDQQLSWCLNPTQDQKDKLDEIKNEPHKGCIAAKGFLELIEGLPLPDYRILPRSERSMFFEEEKQIQNTSSDFSVYPNPTSNYINFVSNINNEVSVIEIFDFTGKMILQIPMDKSGFSYADMSSFSNGIYLAQLKDYGLIRGQTKFVVNK